MKPLDKKEVLKWASTEIYVSISDDHAPASHWFWVYNKGILPCLCGKSGSQLICGNGWIGSRGLHRKRQREGCVEVIG